MNDDPWTTAPVPRPQGEERSFRDFLKENWLWLALIAVAVVPVVLLVGYLALDLVLTDCSKPAPDEIAYCTQ